MINDSIKLAQVWIGLKDLKDKIDNEILPLTNYLNIEDQSLMISMEELSSKIQNHFGQFQLVSEVNKDGKSDQN